MRSIFYRSIFYEVDFPLAEQAERVHIRSVQPGAPVEVVRRWGQPAKEPPRLNSIAGGHEPGIKVSVCRFKIV